MQESDANPQDGLRRRNEAAVGKARRRLFAGEDERGKISENPAVKDNDDNAVREENRRHLAEV